MFAAVVHGTDAAAAHYGVQRRTGSLEGRNQHPTGVIAGTEETHVRFRRTGRGRLWQQHRAFRQRPRCLTLPSPF